MWTHSNANVCVYGLNSESESNTWTKNRNFSTTRDRNQSRHTFLYDFMSNETKRNEKKIHVQRNIYIYMRVCSIYVRATSVSHRKLWLWKLPVIFSYHILPIVPKKNLIACSSIWIHACMYVVVTYHSVDGIWKFFAAIYHVLFAYFFYLFRLSQFLLVFCFLSSHHFILNITVNAYATHNAVQQGQNVELISFINAHAEHISIRLQKKHINSIFIIWSECTCYRGFTALLLYAFFSELFPSIVIPWFSLMFEIFSVFSVHLFLLQPSLTISLFTVHCSYSQLLWHYCFILLNVISSAIVFLWMLCSGWLTAYTYHDTIRPCTNSIYTSPILSFPSILYFHSHFLSFSNIFAPSEDSISLSALLHFLCVCVCALFFSILQLLVFVVCYLFDEYIVK